MIGIILDPHIVIPCYVHPVSHGFVNEYTRPYLEERLSNYVRDVVFNALDLEIIDAAVLRNPVLQTRPGHRFYHRDVIPDNEPRDNILKILRIQILTVPTFRGPLRLPALKIVFARI